MSDKVLKIVLLVFALAFMFFTLMCFITLYNVVKDNSDTLSASILSVRKEVEFLKAKPETQKENSKVLSSISKNVEDLSIKINTVSESVGQLRNELGKKSVEMKENLESTKEELTQKNAETEGIVRVVNNTVNNVIVELNKIKKTTEEDKNKVDSIIKDLKIVQLQVKDLKANVDEFINDFNEIYPNYKTVRKLQKAGISEIK